MTFGALFASILAVTAASDGTPQVVPAEPAAESAAAIAPPARCEATGDPAKDAGCDAGAAGAGAAAAAGTAAAADSAPAPAPAAAPAPATAPEASAAAEAARVVLSASESGTPIVIPSAEAAIETPPATEAPPVADTAAEVAAPAAADAAPATLPAAPAGPPLSEAGPILLERVDDFDGWATERLIEPSGDIVVHSVNASGTVQTCVTVGTLLSLVLVAQEPAAGGEWMHVARDDASGTLVAYTVGVDGEPRAVRVFATPTETVGLAIPAKAAVARP